MNNRKGREYMRTLCFEIDLGETIELGFLREEKRREKNRKERSCWNRIALEVFHHLNRDLI